MQCHPHSYVSFMKSEDRAHWKFLGRASPLLSDTQLLLPQLCLTPKNHHQETVLGSRLSRSNPGPSYSYSLSSQKMKSWDLLWACPLDIFHFISLILIFIEVQLIYSIMLVSVVQQNDPVIHIQFFRFFSIVGYYKTLNIVPCAVQ